MKLSAVRRERETIVRSRRPVNGSGRPLKLIVRRLDNTMASPDSRSFRLWLLGFRTLSFGLVAMGALAAIAGGILALLLVLRRPPPSHGFSLGLSLLFVVVGVLFVLIGIRGIRLRTRHDLEADIAQTANDRDRLERWINR